MERKEKLQYLEKYRELKVLIESLTHSGSKYLNKGELNKVKELCREGAETVNEAYRFIFHYLKKDHAEIRFSAAQLCHELFLEFEEFRKLVIVGLEIFFKYAMGIQNKEPMPPPVSTAKELKKNALQYFFEWHQKFSSKHSILKRSLYYLDKFENVDFRTFEILDPKERKERDEQEKTLMKLCKARLDKSNQEMEELMPEIRCTLTSLESCFELLLPSPDEDEEHLDKECNFEDDMRLNGVVNRKHWKPVEIELSDKVTIKVDDENSAIIDAAKDAFILLNNRFLPKVVAWIETIIKGGGDMHGMENAKALKNKLELAIKKYHRLKFIKENQKQEDDDNDDDDDDDDTDDDDEVSTESDMEEVAIYEPKQPTKKRVTFADEESLFSKKKKEETNNFKDEVTPKPGPSGIHMNERKKKLLEIAPKLPFDIDLYHWEDEKLTAPTILATNSEGAKFWGAGYEDLSELQVPDGVSSLRTRVIEFSGQWEPVNHTCKAPLSSGKLCPRQDRIKCPFHGLIVDRDDEGKIINKDDEERVAKSKTKPDVPDWQDPKLLAEIKAQTGLDLKMPEKGKKRKKKKKKYPGLTDLKEMKNTPKNRISKKIFNKKAVLRVAATLDNIDHKKHRDKFGDQFNYVHGT